MRITSLRGIANDDGEIKSVGDVIVVDGLSFVIEDINTYQEDIDGVNIHHVTYGLSPYVEAELTEEEIQQKMEEFRNL